jgi:hypothetical protein
MDQMENNSRSQNRKTAQNKENYEKFTDNLSNFPKIKSEKLLSTVKDARMNKMQLVS